MGHGAGEIKRSNLKKEQKLSILQLFNHGLQNNKQLLSHQNCKKTKKIFKRGHRV
jgi:hypothetical protein